MPSFIASSISSVCRLLRTDIQDMYMRYTNMQHIKETQKEAEALQRIVQLSVQTERNTAAQQQQRYTHMEAAQILKQLEDTKLTMAFKQNILQAKRIYDTKYNLMLNEHLNTRDMLQHREDRSTLLFNEFYTIMAKYITELQLHGAPLHDRDSIAIAPSRIKLLCKRMYVLVEHVLDSRYSHFIAALPYRMHSYCRFNEIVQLLTLLHEAECGAQNSGLVYANMASMRDMYIKNAQIMRNEHGIPTHALLHMLHSEGKTLIHIYVLQSTQIFLAAIAKKELQHTVEFEFNNNYNRYVSKLATLAKMCDSMYGDNELSCKITYARIVRIIQIHCLYSALDFYKDRRPLSLKLLHQDYNIACALASQLVLSLRATVIMHMLNNNICTSVQNIQALAKYFKAHRVETQFIVNGIVESFMSTHSAATTNYEWSLLHAMMTIYSNADTHSNKSPVTLTEWLMLRTMIAAHYDVHIYSNETLATLLQRQLENLLTHIDYDTQFVQHCASVIQAIKTLHREQTVKRANISHKIVHLQFGNSINITHVLPTVQNKLQIMHMLMEHNAPCVCFVIDALIPTKITLVKGLSLLKQACKVSHEQYNSYTIPSFIEDMLYQTKIVVDTRYTIQRKKLLLQLTQRLLIVSSFNWFCWHLISTHCIHDETQHDDNVTDTLAFTM